jgi:hypothetical protein
MKYMPMRRVCDRLVPWRMGLGHAERAFLHRPGEPITLNAPQVESMQVRQMNNVVDARTTSE